MQHPDNAIVVPYEDGPLGVHETAFSAWCHDLVDTDLVVHEHHRNGMSFLLLGKPVVAWNLTTGREMLCRAVILLESNACKRKDVWTSDDPDFCRHLFETASAKGRGA